jgi:hypothetical protein
MHKKNHVIKTLNDFHRITEAFKLAPDVKVGEFIIGLTKKIIESEKQVKFLEDVIEFQKNQIEQLQLRLCKSKRKSH